MAKVPFSKLKCKINTDEIPLQLGEETITIKQYLPIQEKLALIGRVIMQAHEQDANYSNPVKVAVIIDLELIFAYTNINFTDKQKEDIPKLYDLLYSSGILDKILAAIPEDERFVIDIGVRDSIEAIYKYQNSILGLFDVIKNGYTETEIDIEKMQKSIEELSNMPMLKELASSLGLNH